MKRKKNKNAFESKKKKSEGGALISDTFKSMPAVPRDKIGMPLKCLTMEELVEKLLVEVGIDFI